MKPILVVPLAGLGLRFTDKNYTTPKQMLMLDNMHSCLEKTLRSIKNINEFNVIAYVRDKAVYEHLKKILNKLKVDFHLILGGKTKSPIETLYKIFTEDHLFFKNNPNIFVHTLDIDIPKEFTIDTEYPLSTYIFKANSTNYSYVDVDKDGYVSKIYDQREVGKYANVGIYGFGGLDDLRKYLDEVLKFIGIVSGEIPLVDLYKLIIKNKKVKTIEVDNIYIFGTPSEYEFCKKFIYSYQSINKCYLFSDHSGFYTKEKLKKVLGSFGYETEDLGPSNINIDSDYPDFSSEAINKALKNPGYIFASCSSGQGINISLNKHKDVISAIIYDKNSFCKSIEHNCANAFVFPENIWKNNSFNELIQLFPKLIFSGGRHQNRIIKLLNL